MKTGNQGEGFFNSGVDIQENAIAQYSRDVLEALLKDHTTKKHILWLTHDYESLGMGFSYLDEIRVESITGDNGSVIMPRTLKAAAKQNARAREMAEVFTPSWVCNAQNNLVDAAWFGREDVFNKETFLPDGTRTWEPTEGKIQFPEGKTWVDYVRAPRLEISCGEAPYLASRYDACTGTAIPLHRRIGLLDRKMRIVNENTSTAKEWLKAAHEAFFSIYGYEWQGDNLLLARENLLATFVDYYVARYGHMPQVRSVRYMAYIISWNLFQMDGLKCVIPESCHPVDSPPDLLGHVTTTPCPSCTHNTLDAHTGSYCVVKDWFSKDPATRRWGKPIIFNTLLKG